MHACSYLDLRSAVKNIYWRMNISEKVRGEEITLHKYETISILHHRNILDSVVPGLQNESARGMRSIRQHANEMK
jgi:hypothetical protein